MSEIITHAGGIQRVWKEVTWEDNWNNVIRDVLFQSQELKDEMLVPAANRNNLRDFITNRFVEDVNTDQLVIDEDVRILWSIEGNPFLRGSDHIHTKYLAMDIYVKRNRLYDVSTEDRMKARDVEIAKRIKHLLLKTRSVCNISFRYSDEFRLVSKTVGYQRLRLVFTYFAS